MSRSLLIAALLLSTKAQAWDVPLHLSSHNPGPHSSGPIGCTFTHDDGQEFSGTITSDGLGGLLCSGIAEPLQDGGITSSMTEQGLTAEGSCAAVPDGTEGYADNTELVRTEDVEMDGQALQVYCDDPDHLAPGEVVMTETTDATSDSGEGVWVSLTTDTTHDHTDHEVVVTHTTVMADGSLVEEEVSYGTLTPDASGSLNTSFQAPAHVSKFDVVIRPVDPQGFALPMASFEASETGFETRVRSLEAQLDADGFHVQRGHSGLTLRLDTWGRMGAMNDAERIAPTEGDCADAHPNLPEPCISRVSYNREGITEFWQTMTNGFEQGWDLQTRPPGDGELLLNLTLEGAMDWVVDADGLGAQIRSSQGTVFRYEGLVVWDATGHGVEAALSPTATGLQIAVHCDEDATYPLTIDPEFKGRRKMKMRDRKMR